MTYTTKSFKTKKSLKEAVVKGEEVRIFEPGGFPAIQNGTVTIEGPNYEPHRWYAKAVVKDGKVVKVT